MLISSPTFSPASGVMIRHKAKNVRCLWTMVKLVRLSETQKRQWQNLRISCKHVLWLLQRFVLNISFQFLWLRWVCVSVKDIRFLWKKGGEEGGRQSSCQISAPAPAFIATCISYMLAKWQATNGLLFPFTHVPFLHFCLLRSGVRLQRLLCGDPIGDISLQACAVRRYLTFCLRSLKMCAFLAEYFRLTLY